MSILYTDLIEIDAATSKVNWIAENCPQRYRDIEKLAKAGRLHISRNSQLLDIMPADIFKAMPNLIIMTFLFEASHLCSYMRMHGMLWQKAYICDERLCLGEADLSEKKRELKTLLSLYDGKYNQCGEERRALSATFWDSSQNVAQKYQVVKNIRSFFLTFCHASVTQCMWAVFKERSKSNSHMVKGFKKAFVPFNAKATNEYGDRTYLAYAVNVYDNPMILAWFHDHGQSPDGKLFALFAMIQWIWRSAVRNGLEIRLYLPSKRMRKILLAWLNS